MNASRTWLTLAVGAGLLAGCSFTPPMPPARIVPHAAIRDAADTADGFYMLGRELQRAGKFDDADRAYRQALSLDPAHVEANNGLAAVSASRGDLDLAITILERLVAEQPEQAHLQANLGHAHYLRGNYFEARVALEKAAALDPENPRIRQKLVQAQRKQGGAEADVAVGTVEGTMAEVEELAEPASGIVQIAPGIYELRPPPRAVAPAQSVTVMSDTTTGGGVADSATATELAARAPSTGDPVVPAASKTPAAVEQVTPLTASAEMRAVDPVKLLVPVMPNGQSLASGTPLEILNGNGVPRLARKLRGLLQGSDWKVVRVANYSSFDVRATRIEYAPGNHELANQFAQTLQVEPVYRHNDALGSRVRLVLGHDLRSLDTLRERLVMRVAAAPLN